MKMSYAIDEPFSFLVYQKRPKSGIIQLEEQLQSTKKWKINFSFSKKNF